MRLRLMLALLVQRRRMGIEPTWPRFSTTAVLKTVGATRHPYASGRDSPVSLGLGANL